MQKIEYNLTGQKEKLNFIYYVTHTSLVIFLNQNVSSQLLFFLTTLLSTEVTGDLSDKHLFLTILSELSLFVKQTQERNLQCILPAWEK